MLELPGFGSIDASDRPYCFCYGNNRLHAPADYCADHEDDSTDDRLGNESNRARRRIIALFVSIVPMVSRALRSL